MVGKRSAHFVLSAILASASLMWGFIVTPVAAQQRRAFLIDVPGVDWTGSQRESAWGTLLRPNKITIYIRHQGPGHDHWDEPPEHDAVIVTLPGKWDHATADARLASIVESAFAQKQDVHFIIDKNITLWRHVLPLPERQEDKWAANVIKYISEKRPNTFSGILAEHSRGTMTNDYIEDFSAFSRVIISSPRGYKSLAFIERIKNLPQIDIIVGISDAPARRWIWQQVDRLIKNFGNVRKIDLVDIADWSTTHGHLHNRRYRE